MGDKLRVTPRHLISFVAENFTVPVVFFIVFKTAGARQAIALAVIATLTEAAILRYKKGRISPFFLVISFFTVLFGGLDLLLRVPNYYRYEPFSQSLLVGSLLLFAVIFKIPLARWFAEGLPPEIRPREEELPPGYLRKIVFVFSVYFYLKAFTYLYLSKHLDLGTLMLVRPFIGNLSFLGLLLAEWQYRRRYRKKKRRVDDPAALTSPT